MQHKRWPLLSNQNSFEWKIQQQQAMGRAKTNIQHRPKIAFLSPRPCVRKCAYFFFVFHHLPEGLYPWHVFYLPLPHISLFHLIFVTLVVWTQMCCVSFSKLKQKQRACYSVTVLQASANPIFGGRFQRKSTLYIACVNLFNGLFQSTYYHNHYADNQILIR